MRIRAGASFLALYLALFASSGPVAQSPAKIDQRIIANVNVVQVPVIVFDEKGAVATKLKKDDFHLIDDGVVQQIQYFGRDRVPVSFVILLDVSSSMTRKIPFVQEAALSLLDETQGDAIRDEYSLLGIGSRAKRLLPFTGDQQDLKTQIPLLVSATNESTALFDGIWLSVTTALREARNQHRAVIIISDGGDNHSIYNLRETRRFLEEAAIPVFAVMAGPSFELPEIFHGRDKKRAGPGTGPGPWPQFPNLSPGNSGSDYIGPAERNGPHNLNSLAEVTGGAVFTAQKEEDLPRIVRTIGLAVRYQYLLAYSPLRSDRTKSKSPNEDNVHKIHVELYPKDKFKGYSSPYYRERYHSLQ